MGSNGSGGSGGRSAQSSSSSVTVDEIDVRVNQLVAGTNAPFAGMSGNTSGGSDLAANTIVEGVRNAI